MSGQPDTGLGDLCPACGGWLPDDPWILDGVRLCSEQCAAVLIVLIRLADEAHKESR